MFKRPLCKILCIFSVCTVLSAQAGELNIGKYKLEYQGELGSDYRQFDSSPITTNQDMYAISSYAKPEFHMESENGNHAFSAMLFGRIDKNDDDRSHFDIREMFYRYTLNDKTDIGAGIGQTFWGVTEGRHVVDVINQRDTIEGPLSNEKLGQPMVNLTYYGDSIGTLSLYALPGFRERTFPGRKARLRTNPGPDTHQDANYESSAKDHHVDYAARITKNFDGLDISLSHFYGTSREPVYDLGLNTRNEIVQIPYYELINQTGLELQYAHNNTLYKFEGFSRSGQGDQLFALDTGFEHTMVGVFNTSYDIGLIGEYLYESRPSTIDERGRYMFNPMTNDILIGFRFNLNDAKSTQILSTISFDMDSSAKHLTFKSSRRINDHVSINVQGVRFIDTPTADPAYTLRKDDYIEASVKYYF